MFITRKKLTFSLFYGVMSESSLSLSLLVKSVDNHLMLTYPYDKFGRFINLYVY